jgi:hypothetical protein
VGDGSAGRREVVVRASSCLVLVGLLALAGCARETAPAPVATPRAAPVAIDLPAASAGGACQLLEFAAIERALGARFDTAAADERDGTRSCVLRARGAAHPELTLSVSESRIDPAGFRADVAPKGATSVRGLGSAAYRHVRPAGAGQGPVAEVGWLGVGGRLATLRYALAPDAPAAAAEESTNGLVTLAGTVPVGASAPAPTTPD